MNVEIFDIAPLGDNRYRVALRTSGLVAAYSVTVTEEPVPGFSGSHSLWNLLDGSKEATSKIMSAILEVHRTGSTELPLTLVADIDDSKLRIDKTNIWAGRSQAWFLSTESLNWAIEHLVKRRSNTLFPVAFEHRVIKEQLSEFIRKAQRVNISEHSASDHRQLLVPKSSRGFRQATQLDPLDAIVFTALGYELGEKVEEARVPISDGVVFSFRFWPTGDGGIWNPQASYQDFRERIHELTLEANSSVIVEADISAFYHELRPELISVVLERLGVRRKYAEVLCKFLRSLEIQGLPVGPSISALFAEAVLTPIDIHLLTLGITFVRFNDDYRFFCRNEVEAQSVLQILEDALSRSSGLTIQSSKTTIMQKVDYLKRIENDWTAQLFEEANLVYGEEIDSEDRHSKLIDAARSLLEKALDDNHLARPWECKQAFSSLPLESRREFLPRLLNELPRVSGLAQKVSQSLEKLLISSDGGRDLLELVRRTLEEESSSLPDSASSWLLHAFYRDEWSGKETLAGLDPKLGPDLRAARRELLAALRRTTAAGSVSYDPLDAWQARAHVWATGTNDVLPLPTDSSLRGNWAATLYDALTKTEVPTSDD